MSLTTSVSSEASKNERGCQLDKYENYEDHVPGVASGIGAATTCVTARMAESRRRKYFDIASRSPGEWSCARWVV